MRGSLGGHSKQAINQANLSKNIALVCSFGLPFPNHLYRLVACRAEMVCCEDMGDNSKYPGEGQSWGQEGSMMWATSPAKGDQGLAQLSPVCPLQASGAVR
jgi:hypothetical protein